MRSHGSGRVRRLRLLGLACAGIALGPGAAPGAAAPDWNAVAAAEEVEVVTRDEDGAARETTVWLAVVDGQGYLRTSQSTTWGGNVARDADLMLRIDASEYALRAVAIEDDALRARIAAAFREKYGFTDRMLDLVRGGRPRMLRLDPR